MRRFIAHLLPSLALVLCLITVSPQVAAVPAETVPEEMAENVTDEVAETEIITVKMAETEEVVKRGPERATMSYNGLKWA